MPGCNARPCILRGRFDAAVLIRPAPVVARVVEYIHLFRPRIEAVADDPGHKEGICIPAAIGCDVASWQDATGHQARVEHWSNVAEQARVLVPSLLGEEVPANLVVVPYFWSDQYDVKIQCLGEPEAEDIVHLVSDDGRKFLAYYERDGVVAGVVGGGMPGAVMKTRAKIAAGAPISEVLG